MGVAQIFLRNDPDQPRLDLVGRLSRRQPEAVADPEDVRVHRHGRLAESHVEHHIGRLAADSGQLDQRVAVGRNLAAMIADQRLADSAITFFALLRHRPIVRI